MTVEEKIRDALASDRYAVTGWADPVARIESGVRRRRRRMLLGVSSAVALTTVAALGVAQLRPGSAPPPDTQAASEQPVAWIDDPVARPPAVARRAPRPAARACTAADLGSTGSTAGRNPVSVLLVNAGDSRCTLDAPVSVVAQDVATRRRVTVPAGPALAAVDGLQYPATTDPGEPARLGFAPRQECPGEDGRRQFRSPALVVLGREIPVAGLTTFTACAVSVGRWSVSPPAINAAAQRVTIEAPAEVRRGGRLSYTVTVLNPSDGELRLAPCPVYTQSLAGVARAYRLNCGAPIVGAHASRRFAMEYEVPADAPVGSTLLSWTAVLADGTVATADGATGGVRIRISP